MALLTFISSLMKEKASTVGYSYRLLFVFIVNHIIWQCYKFCSLRFLFWTAIRKMYTVFAADLHIKYLWGPLCVCPLKCHSINIPHKLGLMSPHAIWRTEGIHTPPIQSYSFLVTCYKLKLVEPTLVFSFRVRLRKLKLTSLTS